MTDIPPVLLVSPIICALIGWFTNYLAVKMLFHPREPLNILGLTIQGVFPKRKSALATNLAEAVERELISAADVGKVLNDPAMAQMVHDELEVHVDSLLNKGLAKALPMAAMFLSDEVKAKIKTALLAELEPVVPQVMGKMAAGLEDSLDVRAHVQQRIEAFSMEELESLLFAIMSKEFRFIELMGGVLGFIVGCAQAAFIYVMS